MKAMAACFALAVLAFVVIASAACKIPTFEGVRARWRPSDAQLLDRRGAPLQELRVDPRLRRLGWTALDEVSPALPAAVIASEDRRFFHHRGVDLAALADA